MRCKVVIADDAEATRALFRALLAEQDTIDVVAEAGNGVEALAAVRAHQPDVLLLDLAMPELDGLQVLLALQSEPVDTRVVVLSGFARDRMAPLVLESGATAYLEKGVSAQVLARAVLDACAATPRTGSS
jgi:DNA-binding NarL/FixJ family response regulator